MAPLSGIVQIQKWTNKYKNLHNERDLNTGRGDIMLIIKSATGLFHKLLHLQELQQKMLYHIKMFSLHMCSITVVFLLNTTVVVPYSWQNYECLYRKGCSKIERNTNEHTFNTLLHTETCNQLICVILSHPLWIIRLIMQCVKLSHVDRPWIKLELQHAKRWIYLIHHSPTNCNKTQWHHHDETCIKNAVRTNIHTQTKLYMYNGHVVARLKARHTWTYNFLRSTPNCFMQAWMSSLSGAHLSNL